MRRTTFQSWLPLAAVLIAGLVTTGLTACSTGPDIEEMDHADQAEHLYQQGREALDGGRYMEATEKFNTVRNEYPYSRWAARANLGIADAYFEQEQYASAVQQYRGFVDLYPNHEEVEYASWRVALSFYEQMPSNFFLLPPAYERDLSTTKDAVAELEHFLREFSDSEYAEQAQQKWREAKGRLADHEYYVAEHYFEQNNFTAAIQRLHYLLDNFSGHGLDAEALYMMGRAFLKRGNRQNARNAWSDLVEEHPDHPKAGEVESRLQQL